MIRYLFLLWLNCCLQTILFAKTGKADSLYVEEVLQASKSVATENPDMAFDILNKGIQNCESSGYKTGEYRLRLSYSNLAYDNSLKDSSLAVLKRMALEMEMDPENKLRGVVKHNIGRYYQDRGQYTEALNYLLEAKTDFEHHQNQKGLAAVYGKLAYIYKTQKRYADATEYYELAQDLFCASENWPEYINTTHNYGFMYVAIGEYQNAEALFDEIFYLSEEKQYEAGKELLPFARSTLYAEMGRNEEALRELKKMEKSGKTGVRPDRIAAFNIRMGGLYNSLHNYREAVKYCKKGYLASLELKSMELRKSACTCLEVAHESQGNFKEALKYLQEGISVKDSLNQLETKTLLEEIRAAYDLEKVEKELAQSNLGREKEKNLRLEAEQTALNQRRGRILFVVLLTLAIGFIAFSLWVNRNIQRKNKTIEKALAEKEVLLGEVHHRVKNNLQLITSIIDLQARNTDHQPTENMLGELRNRIHAITLLHQQLYQQQDLHTIRTQEYMPQLLENLRSTLSPADHSIELKYNVQPFLISVASAIPLGLIVSELITNSFRHGFPDGKSGSIQLSITLTGDQAILKVQDNGKGMENASENFGMRMVRSLVRQLKGTMSIQNSSGATIEIVWNQIA